MDRFPGVTIAQDRREDRLQAIEEEAERAVVKPALRVLRRIVAAVIASRQIGGALGFDYITIRLERAADALESDIALELEERGCTFAFIDRFAAEAKRIIESSRRACVAASAQAGDGHSASSRSPAGGPSLQP